MTTYYDAGLCLSNSAGPCTVRVMIGCTEAGQPIITPTVHATVEFDIHKPASGVIFFSRFLYLKTFSKRYHMLYVSQHQYFLAGGGEGGSQFLVGFLNV